MYTYFRSARGGGPEEQGGGWPGGRADGRGVRTWTLRRETAPRWRRACAFHDARQSTFLVLARAQVRRGEGFGSEFDDVDHGGVRFEGGHVGVEGVVAVD